MNGLRGEVVQREWMKADLHEWIGWKSGFAFGRLRGEVDHHEGLDLQHSGVDESG